MADRCTYQIRVQGQISERWAHWFEEMAIHLDPDADTSPTTVLSGPLADQAALLGLLQTLYTLGLPLLSVQRIEPGDAEGPGEMLRQPALRAAKHDR